MVKIDNYIQKFESVQQNNSILDLQQTLIEFVLADITPNLNQLKYIIDKYNFVHDKVTDIYSYYDYKTENINVNFIIIDSFYISNIYIKFDEYEFKSYEVFLNINNNLIFIKNINYKKNILIYSNFNNSVIDIEYNNQSTDNIFTNFKNIIFNGMNSLIKLYNPNYNDIKSFKYYKSEFGEKFIPYSFNNHIYIFNDDLYINNNNYGELFIHKYKNLNINSDNKYNLEYLHKYLPNDGYIIDYNKENNIIKKNIYIQSCKIFESEIIVDKLSHKINKLNNQFKFCDKNIFQSTQIPYFIFDNSCYNYLNLLTVYAISMIDEYNYTINILDKNSHPIKYGYMIDNNGDIFKQDITKIINNKKYNTIQFSNAGIFYDMNENIELYEKCYNNIKCNYIFDYDYLKSSFDIFNKEFTFQNRNNIYNFIINCGNTHSTKIDNIAIVVENGSNTHDISKIILKKDGSVEIIRTNNSNQLIIKSATRNKFEGNIGYKFAVSGNIPCVVTLEIPDDSEVVFDHYHNKFRCNKCVVKDIQPIKEKNVKEIDNTCGVCMIERPNIMFCPCNHVACSYCVASFESKYNNCYICQEKINSYSVLSHDLITDKMCFEKANSAIYCSDFEYKIGETIIIENFDITEYQKCYAGIYFHSTINDVYAWLEFIDIPDELKI
jgi:hypothetical protein